MRACAAADCDTFDARLFPCGWRCAAHEPAPHPVPNPARTLAGLRAAKGIPTTTPPMSHSRVIDDRAIASGKRRSSPERYAEATTNVDRFRTGGRYYTKADAGAPCVECMVPLVKPLSDAGIDMHATCDPEFPALVRAYRRAIAKRQAAA